MAIVSLAQARAHVRVEADYPAEQLQAAIDGAQDAAQTYLNRAVYEDGAALAAARGGYAEAMGVAARVRDAAFAEAVFIDDPVERTASIGLAKLQYREAVAAADRCIHGIVVNPSIQSAVLLIVGHLYANRSAVVTGTISTEVDLGSKSLLRPYRRVMMP